MNTNANAAVHDALEKAIATLGETGLQVAAYHRGELVVDTWAGVADPESGRPVDGDTLFTAFSMSKGVTATIVHRLVERGVLAYDEPLARWWPAFAAHGKGTITLRHALSHRAGLPAFRGIEFADWATLATTGRNLEEATPDWAPGASMSYHGLTFGTLLGRTVELATGKPFAQVLHDEVTGPLGIDDLWCGLPDDAAIHARVATLHAARAADQSTGHTPLTDEELASVGGAATGFNLPVMRAGCMPAAGMIGTARAFARHYAAHREAGLDGVRLLDPSTTAAARVPYFGEDGKTLEWHGQMGMGWIVGGSPHLHCGVEIPGPWADSYGHTGLGGLLSMYCPSHDLSVAMMKNALQPGRLECFTWEVVLRAIAEALAIPYHA
jgi:CubicO group peptidase (beta-lactamase class C family)